MKVKNHRQMMRSLTDSLNIPKLRALIETHPVLTQEEFRTRQNMAKGGTPQLVQPGPGRPGYSGWRKGSPGYDAMLAKGRELRAKAPEGMVWDDKLKKYRKSRIDLHTASNEVKKILEDLPKGSKINRLEIIKKTNVDPSFLTKLIDQYPEKKFNVVRQSSGRPGVIKKGTTPKLEKIAQKVYGKPFEELNVQERGRIRLGKVTTETETAYAKEKINKRFDKESRYRYGKDYKDLNRATQQLIREGRTQTVGGVSSTVWKPREKLKKYVEAFEKRKGRFPYLSELTSWKGAGFNFTMVKKAVDEGVIKLGKSGYANPWQESRMKAVNADLLKLSKNKKILAAFNAADSKELVKLTKDILNMKDASVAEGRIAQLGAAFSGDRYAPNIKKNPILERRVSDVVEGLEMNRRERRRLADLKIGKSVGEATTLASPRQYVTRAYPEKWLYDIDEPAGVLSSVKNKTAPYGVFAQVIDRDVNRKAKKSYDSIKSKQERVVQKAIQSGDKAQIDKAIKNFNDTASKYEEIFAKNTKSGKQKIKLLKISLNKPENTIERFDKLPEGYQNAFKKNYQARGYSFKVPKDLKTAYEIAKDIKNPQVAAMMGKRALAGEARLYSFPANIPEMVKMADPRKLPGDIAHLGKAAATKFPKTTAVLKSIFETRSTPGAVFWAAEAPLLMLQGTYDRYANERDFKAGLKRMELPDQVINQLGEVYGQELADIGQVGLESWAVDQPDTFETRKMMTEQMAEKKPHFETRQAGPLMLKDFGQVTQREREMQDYEGQLKQQEIEKRTREAYEKYQGRRGRREGGIASLKK